MSLLILDVQTSKEISEKNFKYIFIDKHGRFNFISSYQQVSFVYV